LNYEEISSLHTKNHNGNPANQARTAEVQKKGFDLIRARILPAGLSYIKKNRRPAIPD
jgi:hypothetical protein